MSISDYYNQSEAYEQDAQMSLLRSAGWEQAPSDMWSLPHDGVERVVVTTKAREGKVFFSKASPATPPAGVTGGRAFLNDGHGAVKLLTA